MVQCVEKLQQDQRWPTIETTDFRKIVINKSLQFLDALAPKISAVNANEKSGVIEKITEGELKMLAAIIIAVIYLDGKPGRSVNMSSTTQGFGKVWSNAPLGSIKFQQQKTSVKSPTTFMPVTPLIKKLLQDYLATYRQVLAQGGMPSRKIKKVSMDELKHADLYVRMDPNKWFLACAEKNLARQRGLTKWQLIFKIFPPAGGWTKGLTCQRLQRAYSASDLNDALFLDSTGKPMKNFGGALGHITEAFAGCRVTETMLRKIVTTDAAESKDDEWLQTADQALEHTSTVSRMHYQVKKSDESVGPNTFVENYSISMVLRSYFNYILSFDSLKEHTLRERERFTFLFHCR